MESLIPSRLKHKSLIPSRASRLASVRSNFVSGGILTNELNQINYGQSLEDPSEDSAEKSDDDPAVPADDDATVIAHKYLNTVRPDLQQLADESDDDSNIANELDAAERNVDVIIDGLIATDQPGELDAALDRFSISLGNLSDEVPGETIFLNSDGSW